MATSPKKAPTVRDPDDVYQRENRQIVKGLSADITAAQTAIDSNSSSVATLNTQVTGLLAGKVLLNIQSIITTGSTTYNQTPGTTSAWLRMAGGGGGGGGAAGAATGSAAGAGGGSGVYFEKLIVGSSPLVGGSAQCGSGGSAGNTAGSNGGNGGSTTCVINGTTYTATGGGGGGGDPNTGPGVFGVALSTGPVGGSSSGDVVTYWFGEPSLINGGVFWYSGSGGSTPLGAGGFTVTGSTTGNAGNTGGGGGSGAAATTVGKAGGVGGNGLIVIWEFK